MVDHTAEEKSTVNGAGAKDGIALLCSLFWSKTVDQNAVPLLSDLILNGGEHIQNQGVHVAGKRIGIIVQRVFYARGAKQRHDFGFFCHQ